MPLHVLERSRRDPVRRSTATCCASPSPIPATSTRSTSCASRRGSRSSSPSRRATTSRRRSAGSSAQSEAFGARAALDEEAEAFAAEEDEDADDLEVDDGISDAPLVRLVNSVIFQAAEDGASDIHWEPQEDSLVVRLRIDGVLHEVQRIPKRLAAGVTTRLKVLAKLDIAERRKPQDGRIAPERRRPRAA